MAKNGERKGEAFKWVERERGRSVSGEKERGKRVSGEKDREKWRSMSVEKEREKIEWG